MMDWKPIEEMPEELKDGREYAERNARNQAANKVRQLRDSIVAEAVALSRQHGDYDRLMELAGQYEALTDQHVTE